MSDELNHNIRPIKDIRDSQIHVENTTGTGGPTSTRSYEPPFTRVKITSTFDKMVAKRFGDLLCISAAADPKKILCQCQRCYTKSLQFRLELVKGQAHCPSPQCRKPSEPDRNYVERKQANTAIKQEIAAPSRAAEEEKQHIAEASAAIERRNIEIRKRQQQFLASCRGQV